MVSGSVPVQCWYCPSPDAMRAPCIDSQSARSNVGIQEEGLKMCLLSASPDGHQAELLSLDSFHASLGEGKDGGSTSLLKGLPCSKQGK